MEASRLPLPEQALHSLQSPAHFRHRRKSSSACGHLRDWSGSATCMMVNPAGHVQMNIICWKIILAPGGNGKIKQTRPTGFVKKADGEDPAPASIASIRAPESTEPSPPSSPEKELQRVQSSAGLEWQRYVDDGEPWWSCTNGDGFAEDYFFAWRKWQDEAGAPYWHNSETDEWFHITMTESLSEFCCAREPRGNRNQLDTCQSKVDTPPRRCLLSTAALN